MVYKVYIGGLPAGTTEAEIEREFTKFGTLATVWVARKPPGFAFVEYSDSRDADDAVRQLDGYRGWRVEHSRAGAPRERPVAGGYGDRGGYGGRDSYRGGYGRDASPPPRRRRSPSYDRGRRRSPSPYRRRRSPSPAPRRRPRSPSPRRGRSPSPIRRSDRRRDRSETPAGRRSLSPVRSRSPASGRS